MCVCVCVCDLQVEEKLDEALKEFLAQTAKLEEAQSGLLASTQQHSQLVIE